jgi:hypothetical protein
VLLKLTSSFVSGFLDDLVPNARVTAPEPVHAALVPVDCGVMVVDGEFFFLGALLQGGCQVTPCFLIDDGELLPVEVVQQSQQRLNHLNANRHSLLIHIQGVSVLRAYFQLTLTLACQIEIVSIQREREREKGLDRIEFGTHLGVGGSIFTKVARFVTLMSTHF